MKFGERVKTLRIQRGLSQDELARKIGYKDRSSIAKIENGTRDVPRPVIIKLANALSVDASTLMRDDELARIVRRQSEVINEVTLPQETTEIVYEMNANNNYRFSPSDWPQFERFEIILKKNRRLAEDFTEHTNYYEILMEMHGTSYHQFIQLLEAFNQLDSEGRELILGIVRLIISGGGRRV